MKSIVVKEPETDKNAELCIGIAGGGGMSFANIMKLVNKPNFITFGTAGQGKGFTVPKK